MTRRERLVFWAGAAMIFAAMLFVDRLGLAGLVGLGCAGGVLVLFAQFPDFERKPAALGRRYVVETFAMWFFVFGLVVAVWITGTPAVGFGGMVAIFVVSVVMKRLGRSL